MPRKASKCPIPNKRNHARATRRHAAPQLARRRRTNPNPPAIPSPLPPLKAMLFSERPPHPRRTKSRAGNVSPSRVSLERRGESSKMGWLGTPIAHSEIRAPNSVNSIRPLWKLLQKFSTTQLAVAPKVYSSAPPNQTAYLSLKRSFETVTNPLPRGLKRCQSPVSKS